MKKEQETEKRRPLSQEMFMISAMAKSPSPLVGYNTNVRHKGKLYHIQTEDSGVKRPHIITQLFADGGRILASEKTKYDEHLESDDLATTVKKLMQAQHKKVFIGLRDGIYDEDPQTQPTLPNDTEVLDHAAAKLVPGTDGTARRFENLKPLGNERERKDSVAPIAPFGKELLSEKSLDEMILAYLAQDLEES